MREANVVTLPAVTDDGILEGLITVGDITKSYMNVYDSSHTLMQSVQAIEEYDRFTVGFILDEPCYDAVNIEFINKNTGNPYYYNSHLFTVLEEPGTGMSAFAGWGRQSLEE